MSSTQDEYRLRPDLLARCIAIFGNDLIAVHETGVQESEMYGEGIMLGDGGSFFLEFKDRKVHVWVSEWGGFELL